MSITVKVDPVMEAIACKLFGIQDMPATEHARMIRRAAKAGAEALRGQGATSAARSGHRPPAGRRIKKGAAKRFRRRLDVVEAVQLEEGAPAAWLFAAFPEADGWTGLMEASPGDWIIRNGKGRFSLCDPDTFEQMYEPAD